MATSHVEDLTVSVTHMPQQHVAENKLLKLQEKEYIIIKYPHGTRFWQLPQELHFKLDEESLFIVWRGVLTLKTLSVHRIVAVQRGPFTEAFRKFPLPSAEDRSFSIFYLDEKKKGKYAGLKSLDLTCETSEDCNEWIEGLKSLSVHIANHPVKDPNDIWLCQLWYSHAHVKITKPKLEYQMTAKAAMDVERIFSSIKTIKSDLTQESWKEYLSSFDALFKSDLTHKSWKEYVSSLDALFKKGRLHEMFDTHSKSLHSFEEFLSQHCQWGRNSRQAVRHTTQHTSDLTFADFLRILRHEDNTAMNPDHSGKVWQDMTQPLPHYFINSSHNTYLEGNQLKSRSACEAYIYALLQGCRCVEIDCWNDRLKSGGEDISVHHGYTFTSKLAFTDVVDTLTWYSFLSSKYPVIISIENHCNRLNQSTMAEIFQSKMEQLCNDDYLPNGRLPSPDNLSGKIILKGKHKESEQCASKECLEAKMDEGDTIKGSSKTDEEDEDIENDDLNSLITYCRSTKFKELLNPNPNPNPNSDSVRKIFSGSEGDIRKVITDPDQDVVSWTEKNLVRVYPPGTNTNSANYDPTLFWSSGCQIVALNFQKPDLWMQLNQGFFRQNGGCGYVLKPQVMRDPTQYGYSPCAKPGHPIETVPVVHLEIELISGQQLCPYWRKCRSVTVEISTYGIPADTSTELTAESRDAFWPQWGLEEKVYRRDIVMPELCLVYFNVLNTIHPHKTVQYAQNCIPLISLQPGIRYVPLRTPGGTLIPESGIFVHITKRGGASPQTQVLHTQSSETDHKYPDQESEA